MNTTQLILYPSPTCAKYCDIRNIIPFNISSLSRYKLKFSPDKVDTMIVQAISLLDDLDKELNNYAMRCREWYGWHFPEFGKIVTDNLVYAKAVKKIGMYELVLIYMFMITPDKNACQSANVLQFL